MNTKKYNTYHIKETDRFDANYFTKIQWELDDIQKAMEAIPAPHKAELFISFLKDHTLEKDEKRNPALTELLSSGSLVTTQLEALYNSSRANKTFLREFEDHIRETLAQPAV